MTPSESERLGRNKWHFAFHNGNLTSCGRYVFSNPALNVTSDPAKVTCALCLRWLPPQKGLR